MKLSPVEMTLFAGFIDQNTTRRCNDCHMCCEAMAVEDVGIAKPINVRCEHLDQCGLCKIYKKRPEICQAYYCGWRVSEMMNWGVPEGYKPSQCGFVIQIDPFDNPYIITIFPDPHRPDAWKAHKKFLEDLARKNDMAVIIGGWDNLTKTNHAINYVTPKGVWRSKEDFPHCYGTGDEGQMVNFKPTDFRRYAREQEAKAS